MPSSNSKSSQQLLYISRLSHDLTGNAAYIHTVSHCKYLSRLYDVLLVTQRSDFADVDQFYALYGTKLVFTPFKGLIESVVSHFYLAYLILFIRPAIVFFRGPSYFLLPLLSAKLLNLTVLVELNGVFKVDMISNKHLLRTLFSPLYSYQRLCNKAFLELSNHVVCVTAELNSYVIRQSPRTNVIVSRNGSEPFRHSLLERPSTYHNNIINLCYLGKVYQRESVFKLIELFATSPAGMSLTLIGDLLDHTCFKRYKNLKNYIAIVPEVPYENLPLATKSMHLGFCAFSPSHRNSITGLSPIKLSTYCALKIPFICSEMPELMWAKAIPGIFWLKDGFNYDDIYNLITNIRQSYSAIDLIELGEFNYQYFMKHLTWEHHVDRIVQSIKQQ